MRTTPPIIPQFIFIVRFGVLVRVAGELPGAAVYVPVIVTVNVPAGVPLELKFIDPPHPNLNREGDRPGETLMGTSKCHLNRMWETVFPEL